jgi:aspartate/methionine/tyrosine aminotransferase
MIQDVAYLRWAEERYGAVRIDLATSGIPEVPAAELGPLAIDDQRMRPRFTEAVAARYTLDRAEVVTALGTSQALWLACAATLEPGDDVLCESPAYEPVWRIPEGLGANVRRFPWFDPDAIAAALTPRTRLVIATSLHNPTGHPIPREAIASAAAACAATGAYLVIDEVYADFEPGPARTSRAIAPNVIAVSSLTKRYGLGWARAGWVLAPPDVAERARYAVRHSTGQNGTAPSATGVAALSRLDDLRARADTFAAGKKEIVADWIRAHPRLSWDPPAHGIFGWIRVPGAGDLRPGIERLCAEHGVLVAAGSFFGVPDAFRVAWTQKREALQEGLALIAESLGVDQK